MEDSRGTKGLDWHGAKPEVLPEETGRLPLPYAHFLSSAAAAAVLLSFLHRGFLFKGTVAPGIVGTSGGGGGGGFWPFLGAA
jgi:hypothetical protein